MKARYRIERKSIELSTTINFLAPKIDTLIEIASACKDVEKHINLLQTALSETHALNPQQSDTSDDFLSRIIRQFIKIDRPFEAIDACKYLYSSNLYAELIAEIALISDETTGYNLLQKSLEIINFIGDSFAVANSIILVSDHVKDKRKRADFLQKAIEIIYKSDLMSQVENLALVTCRVEDRDLRRKIIDDILENLENPDDQYNCKFREFLISRLANSGLYEEIDYVWNHKQFLKEAHSKFPVSVYHLKRTSSAEYIEMALEEISNVEQYNERVNMLVFAASVLKGTNYHSRIVKIAIDNSININEAHEIPELLIKIANVSSHVQEKLEILEKAEMFARKVTSDSALYDLLIRVCFLSEDEHISYRIYNETIRQIDDVKTPSVRARLYLSLLKLPLREKEKEEIWSKFSSVIPGLTRREILRMSELIALILLKHEEQRTLYDIILSIIYVEECWN